MKHTSVLYYACLAGLLFLMPSCIKETVTTTTEAEPFVIKSPITAEDIDSSWLDRTLTFEEVHSLGLANDLAQYEQVPLHLHEASSEITHPQGNICGNISPTTCCQAGSLVCDVANVPNVAFRPVGCFDGAAYVQDLRLTLKVFINGQFSSYLTHYEVQLDPFGCVYYDPFVIRDEDGNITHYFCAVFYRKLGVCPAVITVESEWRYTLPEDPGYIYCGFNTEDYIYPGFPDECDWH